MNDNNKSTKLENFLLHTKQWALGIMQDNEDLISNAQEFLDAQKINYENDTKLLKHILMLREGATSFEEYAKLDILYSACTSLRIIFNVEEACLRHPEISGILYSFYNLGLAHGALEAVEPDKMPSQLYQDYFHRQKSSRFVKERRWEQRKKEEERLLNQIKVLALKKYESGYNKFHNELAYQFHKMSEFKGISLKKIRKVIGPIAEKYDKKLGIPKKY